MRIALLCLSLLVAGSAGALDLVVNGEANAVLVVPDTPWPAESYAATELQYIVEKASGATLRIVGQKEVGAGENQILLGRAAGLALDGVLPAGFKIKTGENTLEMAGNDGQGAVERLNTATGTLYAVYEWAERQLGVRWLWPDVLGEAIPVHKNIAAGDHELTWQPKLTFASVRQFDWRWNRRLLRADMSRYTVFAGCPSQGHAFGDWHKRYGKEHPDYFEMTPQGHRVNDRYASMCVSNPALHRQIVDNWLAAKRPDRGVNAKENDCNGRCACPDCLAWDGEDIRWPTVYYAANKNVGERYAKFYKAVWELAAQTNPDVKVGAYAYMNYVYAPRTTQLNKNILIGFVDDLPFPRTPEYQEKVNREIELWGKSGATLYFRPNHFLSGYAMPEIHARQYAEQFRLAFANGMAGLDVDGPNNSWATVGPNLYVMTRLVIDPERPAEELLREFYGGFGPAAPAVEAYFSYWEKYVMDNAARFNRIFETETVRKWFFYGFHYASVAHRLFPDEVFAPAREFLAEAARLATGDKEAEARVDFLLQGFNHARLCAQTSAVCANPESDNTERLKAIAAVKEMRKTLRPCVADVNYFEGKRRLEDVAWVMKDLDPANATPLPEQWRTALDPENRGRGAGFFRPDFPDDDWTPRSTWGFLEDQGVEGIYRLAWYRLAVTIPEERRDWRVILRLGAMDESGWVWVNGKQVGELIYDAAVNPRSWEEPQEYDITDAVKFGGENHVAVLVENLTGKGGLWRPSFIRYERATSGERMAVKLPANRTNATKTTVDGVEALRMVGRPDLPGNDWLTSVVALPYENVGGSHWRLSASIKTEHLGGGEFWLVLREINAAGATVTYQGFTIKEEHDWREYSRDLAVRDNTAKLAVFAVGKGMGGKAIAIAKDVMVERLK